MSSLLAQFIADLSSAEASKRLAAAGEIYRLGRAAAGSAISNWWAESELSGLLLGPHPAITVGLAVERDTFGRIRMANGTPRLAEVPADQDAEEFDLRFADGVFLDLLTTSEPGGSGAIAKYLAKFGEGVQQVEYRCTNVDRATQILKDKFGVELFLFILPRGLARMARESIFSSSSLPMAARCSSNCTNHSLADRYSNSAILNTSN